MFSFHVPLCGLASCSLTRASQIHKTLHKIMCGYCLILKLCAVKLLVCCDYNLKKVNSYQLRFVKPNYDEPQYLKEHWEVGMR